jgi:hypothetical protein
MMASFPDTSRRMFRGRAGPTDRRLNKHQARRRKYPRDPRPEKNNKYGDFNEKDGDDQERGEDHSVDEDNVVDEDGKEHRAFDCELEILDQQMDEEPGLAMKNAGFSVQAPEEGTPHPAVEEIKHLLKRIKNVSESITLSAGAISNPLTWKANVLNAVLNVVNEWQAILKHYPDLLDDSHCVKEPALQTYVLMQQALQSGPLTGSNPGYFKRCGAQVAKLALDFLESCPNPRELSFTENQIGAVGKWKLAAAKAVEVDKPPSKTQFKRQQGKKGNK